MYTALLILWNHIKRGLEISLSLSLLLAKSWWKLIVKSMRMLRLTDVNAGPYDELRPRKPWLAIQIDLVSENERAALSIH